MLQSAINKNNFYKLAYYVSLNIKLNRYLEKIILRILENY